MALPSMINVTSSNIAQVGYLDGDLYVKFHDGAVYKHKSVPGDLFQAIQDSDSPGKFYHGRIKGKFESEKMPEGFAEPAPIVDDNGNNHPVTTAEEAEANEKAKAEAAQRVKDIAELEALYGEGKVQYDVENEVYVTLDADGNELDFGSVEELKEAHAKLQAEQANTGDNNPAIGENTQEDAGAAGENTVDNLPADDAQAGDNQTTA